MSMSPLFALAGIASWTFGEYALHNWLGHLGKGRNAFSREHLAHHADSHYFTATRKKVRTAVAVIAVATTALALAIGVANALFFSAGFSAMYTAYEVIHRRTHTHAPRGWYSRWARRHHFLHHYGSPKMNHGVTTPIWDIVFRTYEKPGRVRVPVKHAPAWLMDPDTGEVRPQYAADYEIARKRRRRRSESDRPAIVLPLPLDHAPDTANSSARDRRVPQQRSGSERAPHGPETLRPAGQAGGSARR